MIRNIVFDVGNVLVRWDPLGIVQAAYGLEGEAAESKREAIFGTSDHFRALNRGEMTVEETKAAYVAEGVLDEKEAHALFAALFESLTPVPGTEELMVRLKNAGFGIYALTDNVHEIVAYLKETRSFWPHFQGAAVSADIGCLKPDPRIYLHLLETHGLEPEATVFFDDLPGNVAGAKEHGMHAFVFTTAEQMEADLATLGVEPPR